MAWAVALIAAPCAPASVGDHSQNAPSPTRQVVLGTARPSSTTQPAVSADPRVFDVQLGDHYFDPQVIVIKVGMTVRWRSTSGVHDITARDGSFRSPPLAGGTFSYTFNTPGHYRFLCTIHAAEMQGEVVVEPEN